MNLSDHVWIVIIPLIFSNVLHMLVVKLDFLRFLNRPIWAWGFGKNKTLRGLILVPVFNMTVLFAIHIWFSLSSKESLFLGAMLGLCYVLAELPNSFIKRRLGVASGMSNQQSSVAFLLMDKVDSALGVSIGYFFMAHSAFLLTLQLFFCSVMVHVLFSYLLVKLRIKSSF